MLTALAGRKTRRARLARDGSSRVGIYARRVSGETRAERVRDGLLEARLILRSAGKGELPGEPERVLLDAQGAVTLLYPRAAYTPQPDGLRATKVYGSLVEHSHYSHAGKLLDRRLGLVGRPERN